MSRNPYIRPGLEATRSHIPDPGIEVEDWLDKLADLLDGRSPQGRAHQAYDLLALWAKLQRIEPTLLAKHGGDADFKRAKAVIDEKGSELAQLALTVPNSEAWLAEAQALGESYEDLIDPVQRAELAEHLLDSLDDAELAVYAARQIGLADAELNQQLEICARWVAEQPDLFLAAAVYVQAVGMALRTDLADWDAELALTAEKYVQVLDAQEIAEAELSFANQPRVSRAVVEHLFSFARKKGPTLTELVPGVATHDWFEWPEPLLMAAATAGPAADLAYLDWRSPDKRCTATLVFDPQGTGPVRINFYHSDALAAILTGQQALLAGVPAQAAIDQQGNADFARDSLWKACSEGQPLTLQVGSDFWEPIEHPEQP